MAMTNMGGLAMTNTGVMGLGATAMAPYQLQQQSPSMPGGLGLGVSGGGSFMPRSSMHNAAMHLHIGQAGGGATHLHMGQAGGGATQMVYTKALAGG